MSELSSEADSCLPALRKRLLAELLRKHVEHSAQTPAALIVKNNIYSTSANQHDFLKDKRSTGIWYIHLDGNDRRLVDDRAPRDDAAPPDRVALRITHTALNASQWNSDTQG
ncbi:unnamed protein product [Euphydryas editha]|uniref:Uncharacterized protein n=1 Tax=Euphydryas editha TaxID=104508 RepID=A0AAU9VDV4_EUPED|nr:unnamed protein product [Euphydryas editha]